MRYERARSTCRTMSFVFVDQEAKDRLGDGWNYTEQEEWDGIEHTFGIGGKVPAWPDWAVAVLEFDEKEGAGGKDLVDMLDEGTL